MSAKGLFSFLAGAAIGAAAIWLATTDEGRAKVDEFKKKASEGIDSVKNKVSEKLDDLEEKVEGK